MAIRKIISVTVNQEYYQTGLAEGLSFAYGPETAKQLRKLAIKPKFSDHGIELYTEERHRIASLSSEVQLTFDTYCADPHLRTHSQLPFDASATIVYRNDFHTDPGVLSSSAAPKGIVDGQVVLAQVALTLSADLFSAEELLDYQIHWPGKAAVWRYYYVGPRHAAVPEVSHNTISFLRHEIKKDSQFYLQDQLARNLLAHFPDAHHWVFISTQSVRWKSAPYKDIALKRDDEIIIASLPNPRQEQDGNYIINALPN